VYASLAFRLASVETAWSIWFANCGSANALPNGEVGGGANVEAGVASCAWIWAARVSCWSPAAFWE